jgi:hypothetical protein
MASAAPGERLNFNNQYVVSHGSQTQTHMQPPQSQTMLPSQEPKGLFDGHFARNSYINLYNDGDTDPNPLTGTLKRGAGLLGGSLTELYLGGTNAAQTGVNNALTLAGQGRAEGGFLGKAKEFTGNALTFIPSQFTEERAPGSMVGLATVPLFAAGATTKFGQAVLSNPFVQRGVLPTLETAGVLFSGKQLHEGATGKDLLTGEQLSEEERISRTGQAGLGILGTGYWLKGKGKQIIEGAKAIPGNVSRLGQQLTGQPPKLALPGGVKINPAEVELTQPLQMKGETAVEATTVPQPKRKEIKTQARSKENEREAETTLTKADETKGKKQSTHKEGEKERGSCSDAGHKYAKGILLGGTYRAYAGHGEFRYGTNPKVFTIPEGSSLSLWSKMDVSLPDNLGRLIETGRHDQLTELFLWDDIAQERLTGAATHLPGAKIPNYTLSAPTKLKIHQNSITVEDPATLSELLQPNSGHFD